MHPILIQFGNFYISTYGLMMALGMLAAAVVIYRRSRQEGLPADKVMDAIFFAVLAGIVGGRLGYIVVDLATEQRFLEAPLQVLFSRAGFVFLGGVVLAVPTLFWYCRRKGLSFLSITDVFAAALPLGHAFGRVGCFLFGCCYGAPVGSGNPLGVCYPAPRPVGEGQVGMSGFYAHVRDGLIAPECPYSAPVWPVQLFESLGNLLIFIGLAVFWKHRRFRGQIFLAYLVAYGVLRFCLEFFRGDTERGFVGMLSTSQVISLLAITGGIAGWVWLRKKKNISATNGLCNNQKGA